MMNILVMLPYSGANFGGGLAMVNAQLTKALADLGHNVKLLTMKLPGKFAVDPAQHGNAGIIEIEHEEVTKMKDPGGFSKESGDERDTLYRLFNNHQDVLAQGIAKVKEGGWTPNIIIGHSRFSGPAAIQVKRLDFPGAKVEYFLHSFPFEGAILTGYDAYEEPIDPTLARKKLEEEKEWMPQADIVVGMGPLMRLSATYILQKAKAKNVRVHEAISGIEVASDVDGQLHADQVVDPHEYNLLMVGRFGAPIKGLEDILLAALKLRDDNDLKRKVRFQVLSVGTKEYASDRTVDSTTVQTWVNEVLHGTPEEPNSENVKVRIEVLPPQDSKGFYPSAHAVLAPSYIEHFGLVPFEALGFGRPVLVNELSGSGLFLGDANRFPEVGPPCVVNDFDAAVPRPLGAGILGGVNRNAFDSRPGAWAEAIKQLVNNYPDRRKGADELRRMLGAYTLSAFAVGIVAAADDKWEKKITVQGPNGAVLELGVPAPQ